MRIALVSTLATRVSEVGAGSVESLVWLLARELKRLGHEPTVFAAAGSETSGETVASLPGTYANDGAPSDYELCEWINLSRAVEASGRFDVIHTHAYLWGLTLERLSQAPMVHTTHVMPGEDQAILRAMNPGACVTAISKYQWRDFEHLPPIPIIHHGINADHFTFRSEPDDYLCFLGRFTGGKGPLLAIDAAKSLGMKLRMAGPRSDYYRKHVEPLVDGTTVEYVGTVTGADRDRLLGGAKALVYPLLSPEPFGLVMPEAMMCGTPVAALRLGAVEEIVDEGTTGHCAESAKDLPQSIRRCLELDRSAIRQRAAKRFSAERMARQYVEVYERLVQSRRGLAAADWPGRELK